MNEAAAEHDVIILGGGPAGMAAALIAGRARLKTVVISDQKPRNLVTTASHGFVTHDGAHPSELADAALEQLKKYKTVTTVERKASTAESKGTGFAVTDETGTIWSGKRVIIATGYRDVLDSLSLPGVADVYGKTVYPCPFCDGFEHADERFAVFMADGVEHFVPVVRVWSEDVVVFTNGRELSVDQKSELTSRGVGVEEGRVAKLHSERGVLTAVELQDGKRIERDAGFIGDDYSVEATSFAQDLGVNQAENSWGMTTLDADAAGRTNVDGVYVVGDAKSGFGGLTAAAFEGAACAEGVVHDIASKRWQGA